MNENNIKKDAAVCRWTGRIIGVLLVFTILVIAVGQGLPNPLVQPVRVQLGFLALGLMVLGMVAAWRWEFSGGIVSLLGWGLFVLAVIRSPKHMDPFVMALALPGLLCVTSALLRHYQKKRRSASPAQSAH